MGCVLPSPQHPIHPCHSSVVISDCNKGRLCRCDSKTFPEFSGLCVQRRLEVGHIPFVPSMSSTTSEEELKGLKFFRVFTSLPATRSTKNLNSYMYRYTYHSYMVNLVLVVVLLEQLNKIHWLVPDPGQVVGLPFANLWRIADPLIITRWLETTNN